MRVTLPKSFRVLLCVAALLAGGGGATAAQDTQDLPPVLDDQGQPVEDAVNQLVKLNLGGIGQWVLLRGRSRENPVLLVLHGGPGEALMPWVDLFQTTELEANFVVVQWDQRGAGKSYQASLGPDRLGLRSYVDDTLELTDLLRRRFGKDKIFLTGTSWGSALGFMTLERDSEPFHAFIAAGEYVDWKRSQTTGFDWAKARAKASGDAEALKAIASIEPFDPADARDVAAKDRLVQRLGGGDLRTQGLEDLYRDYAANGDSPYMSKQEYRYYEAGETLARNAVVPQMANYDLFEDFPASPIPIHFIDGEEDRLSSVALVEDYATALDAPAKSLTIVQSAGHMVPLDAPQAWAKTLIRIARETLGR